MHKLFILIYQATSLHIIPPLWGRAKVGGWLDESSHYIKINA